MNTQCIGLSEDPGISPTLPSRFRRLSDGVLEQRPRSDLGAAGLHLLRNEARTLARLAGWLAPKLVEFVDGQNMVLRRQFVAGPTLNDVDRSLWSPLLADFAGNLARVHERGLVHGDLRPENLIVTGDGLIAIDWEHALTIGADIASRPARAATPGYSHPRLIWGRGQVDEDLDRFSIYQMLGGENPLLEDSGPVMF